MADYTVLVFLLFGLIPAVLCGLFAPKHRAHYNPDLDKSSAGPGDPLFLTPYIEQGQIAQARQLSQVHGILGITSYSGFLTVDETFNSNMFFWFFPAQKANQSAPLLLWLQGGPGGSSLFGLFVENGPLYVDRDAQVYSRSITWNSDYHMLYIDNPVGTGFSFTNSIGGFSTNEDQVATNLYSALTQFFTVFYDYQPNDFYITGESYAGKYIPAIGLLIHTMNSQSPKVPINLVGLAIGDGLCDPVNMFGGYAELVYQFGMADEIQRDYIQKVSDEAVQCITQGDFRGAFNIFDMLMNGDLYPYPTYFYNITGSTDYYNILNTKEPAAYDYYVPFVNRSDTRFAIHVGNLSYGAQSVQVETSLLNDIMDTVAPRLATLMDNYKVMIYNGQLDIIVGAPLSERFLTVLSWTGQSEYLAANRTVWKISPSDEEVAGYIRQVGKFWQVVVRGAGHILPYDQPERGLNLIQNFINS